MWKKGKWLVAIAIMLLIAIPFNSLTVFCQKVKGPRMGGTLVVAYWGDPKSFNPDAQVDDAGAGIYRNVFSQLVTLDVDYNVIPDLAYKWDVSPDGKTYTFYLYRNVTWHDGYPFTAEDVKWTLEAIKKFRGVAYSLIKADNIESIECPDDYTVVIHLKKPYAPFLGFLAWYGTWIMPAHIYKNYTDWMSPEIEANRKPVGTGPFKLVEWVKGDHITLVANEKYFRGRPYLDKIVYKIIPDASIALQAFLAKEADLLAHRPPLAEIPRLQKTPGVNVVIRPIPSRWYIGFNLKKSPFNDSRVRLAIAYAINRSEIVEKALSGFGEPAEGTYTPAIAWAYNPHAKLPPYDPAKAEKILDEAGYKRGPNGIRFTITYTCWSGPEEEAIGNVIKDNLKKIGIEVKLEVLEFNIWEEKVVKRRDFDIALCDGFQGPDPANLKIRVGAGEYINFAGYNNTEVERLFELGATTTDLSKRKEIYWKIQEILAKDLPYLTLADLVIFHIWSSEFHGFPWEPEAKGKVGYGNYRLVWWEGGKPLGG